MAIKMWTFANAIFENKIGPGNELMQRGRLYSSETIDGLLQAMKHWYMTDW